MATNRDTGAIADRAAWESATTAFPPLSERIVAFAAASRGRAERHGGTDSPREANFLKAFLRLYQRRPYWERYARSLAYALEREPVYLADDERLVGMLYQLHVAPATPDDARCWATHDWRRQALARQEHEIEPYLRGGLGPGHIGWRWDRIVAQGIDGLMADIRARLATAPDAAAKRLYRGSLIMLGAVLRWNDRHVAAIEAEAGQTAGAERKRLEGLAALCRRVPRLPARTFHEAVQSFYMLHLAVMFENPFGGNGPGRVDYFLWPYLERDLAAGTTTLGEAKGLIDELFLRFDERLWDGDGWVESVTVGGVHPDGTSSVNPLSYMMVQSAGALGITHPAVYARLSGDSPTDFVDLCTLYLLHGHNRAQIYNDDACLPAIRRGGVSAEDAAMYMAGGCMEISAQGLASDLNITGTHNVAKTLELVLNGGVDMLTGEQAVALADGSPPPYRTLADYGSFEELYAAFEAELEREYAQLIRAYDINSECMARYRPCYLLSSVIGDCLERGREQQDGGARYHDYGFAPLAITAAADSLAGVRRAVFDEGFVSGAELLAALRADFHGHERLQARLRRLPRYGVEDDLADSTCDRVLRSVCAAATRAPNRFGGHLKPMIFNFVWTPGASRQLAARADGCRAGETIGQGMTPTSAAATEGITAAIGSATRLDYSCVSGGATTMWDMDEQWITPELMRTLLTTFMARGGMIFQGNTTSVRELERALEHPERYQNLVVRVGGFSARFVTLNRDVQEDVIRRRRWCG